MDSSSTDSSTTDSGYTIVNNKKRRVSKNPSDTNEASTKRNKTDLSKDKKVDPSQDKKPAPVAVSNRFAALAATLYDDDEDDDFDSKPAAVPRVSGSGKQDPLFLLESDSDTDVEGALLAGPKWKTRTPKPAAVARSGSKKTRHATRTPKPAVAAADACHRVSGLGKDFSPYVFESDTDTDVEDALLAGSQIATSKPAAARSKPNKTQRALRKLKDDMAKRKRGQSLLDTNAPIASTVQVVTVDDDSVEVELRPVQADDPNASTNDIEVLGVNDDDSIADDDSVVPEADAAQQPPVDGGARVPRCELLENAVERMRQKIHDMETQRLPEGPRNVAELAMLIDRRRRRGR
jgi:hypothetical protein